MSELSCTEIFEQVSKAVEEDGTVSVRAGRDRKTTHSLDIDKWRIQRSVKTRNNETSISVSSSGFQILAVTLSNGAFSLAAPGKSANVTYLPAEFDEGNMLSRDKQVWEGFKAIHAKLTAEA